MVDTPVPRIVGGYQLLERLASGGIGEVWKARDRLLNRIVALKFISPHAGDASRLGDLVHEARAASALNHPNIVTIFQVGESEAGTYLAMEFVEGETLRARMLRGTVPLGESLQIVKQVIDGLASAHTHGIVHRDLKPENIMLRIDGRVKLVDFGLAKVLPWQQAGGSERLVETAESGQLTGTFQYMSPEQARGRAVTPATDVFSFGIVLYELIAGEHPFARESVLDTLNAIVGERPVDLKEKCRDAPREVSEIATRALQKHPSERYATAAEIVAPLERAITPAHHPVVAERRGATPRYRRLVLLTLLLFLAAFAAWIWWPRPSTVSEPVQAIAVMNFRTSPDDARALILAEGLPEDLSVALAAAGFRIASRSSVIDLGANANARTAGASLGVDVVLEGTVRSQPDGFRIYIELVSARTRFQVWSRTFTARGAELTGDSEVAQEIAGALRTAVQAGR